jgi:hypothetical protein
VSAHGEYFSKFTMENKLTFVKISNFFLQNNFKNIKGQFTLNIYLGWKQLSVDADK